MTRRDRPIGRVHGISGDVELPTELIWGRRGVPSAPRIPTDVYVTDDPPALNVTVDAAGLDPATLEVVLDGDVLSIAGERRRPDEHGRRAYQHVEIEWGRFERHLRLGTAVDPETARVQYERGLLRIALPLAELPVIRRVMLTVRIG